MARHPRPVNARPARRDRRRAGPLLALASLALAAGAGCSLFEAPTVRRGNRVEAEQLAQIQPGVQTRADVLAVLGSPSARGTFDDDRWFYIAQTTRTRPGRVLALDEQRVVAITFDRQGMVREIRELTESDARSVAVVSRETPVPGNDRTFLQALFGNIGRVSAGGTGPAVPGP